MATATATAARAPPTRLKPCLLAAPVNSGGEVSSPVGEEVEVGEEVGVGSSVAVVVGMTGVEEVELEVGSSVPVEVSVAVPEVVLLPLPPSERPL